MIWTYIILHLELGWYDKKASLFCMIHIIVLVQILYQTIDRSRLIYMEIKKSVNMVIRHCINTQYLVLLINIKRIYIYSYYFRIHEGFIPSISFPIIIYKCRNISILYIYLIATLCHYSLDTGTRLSEMRKESCLQPNIT